MRPPKKKVDSPFSGAVGSKINEAGNQDAIRLEGDNDWPVSTIGVHVDDGEETALLDFCHEISRKA